MTLLTAKLSTTATKLQQTTPIHDRRAKHKKGERRERGVWTYTCTWPLIATNLIVLLMSSCLRHDVQMEILVHAHCSFTLVSRSEESTLQIFAIEE
jgi:hypothetical protein